MELRLAFRVGFRVSRCSLASPRSVREKWGQSTFSRGQDSEPFDLPKLAAASEGFSGAEIEQAIVSALYAAHGQSVLATTEHVLHEIDRTQPLSVVMAETVAQLRSWAHELPDIVTNCQ